MIKVYQVSRRYIMLFMHNNKYLPLTGLLTLLQWTIHNTACIVLHLTKYFDIYGVKWRQYVTPVVVCELVLISYWKVPIIDSFDVHYSKICWTLQERYSCRFVFCTGCILIDVVRCSISWNFWNISEIFHEIFHGKKNHEILHHYCWN